MQGKSFIALIVCLYITIDAINCAVLTDRDPRGYKQFSSNQIDTKAKRPFCNAFTGCGRKRSNEIAPVIQMPAVEEDNLTELLELNSEPAIEELMRQIMSEAKMYEAIQEANRELFMQKLKHTNNGNRIPQSSAYSMQ